jgi:ribosomal protein L11 methyltransferase
MKAPLTHEHRPGQKWYALDVVVDVIACEAIEYGLMEARALGTETNSSGEQATVRGYFEANPDLASVRATLLDALRIYDLHPQALIDLQASEVPDRDWLAEWKKNWQPVEVGRFIIAPPWFVSVPGAIATGSGDSIGSDDPVATAPGTDTIVVLINPGMAFGTGTHETTRLCLKAIEKHYRGGSFLDVGTGTGILAIAAAKTCQEPDSGVPSRAARLGWGGEGGQLRIHACDVDADAIAIAKENAELNGVAALIDFRVGSVDEITESADLVCANLTAPVIVELLPALIGATCGRLILSGILDSQIDLVKSRLLELGVIDFQIDQDGEWIAITA